MKDDKRLIEDYLPIAELSAIASKEKKHPEHPVALIHYWPARRPPTACRAAVYAALVGAPANASERRKVAQFVTALSGFNTTDQVIADATANILGANGNEVPKVLDVFAGGGAIPLEAARIGCDSYAIEYNPVAYLVELCTIVYPQRFGTTLADDVERSGNRILEALRKQTEDWYPEVVMTRNRAVAEQLNVFGEGTKSPKTQQPISYIWVRTVPCRKPGCGAPVPLVRQSWLRKKGGQVSAVPYLKGNDLCWRIVVSGEERANEEEEDSGGGRIECLSPSCKTTLSSPYVKECALAGKMGESLAAIVLQGPRSKLYVPSISASPSPEVSAKSIADSLDISLPDEKLRGKLRDQLPAYGFDRFADLFTQRQLGFLLKCTAEIRSNFSQLLKDGMERERAIAVTSYLALAFGRLANSFNRFCRWQGRDQITIASIGDRQALKMVSDFSEINPFADTAGCLPFAFKNEVNSIRALSRIQRPCTVTRGSAENLPFADCTFDAVVTDPPYYDSIFYSDLSGFFYVWLRRIVGDLYPEHFAAVDPPHKREAVAQPSKHDGDERRATEHYEKVMSSAFMQVRRVLKPNAPLVCVYAHKTTSGWASLIRILAPAGLTVTEAWPLQTEAKGRSNAIGAAALSDSIFLVARRRDGESVGQFEDQVIPELQQITAERVETLWDLGISGADLVISSVGAGLRAFTRFTRVEYANGEVVPAERFLAEVEAVVLETILAKLSKAVGAKNGQATLAGMDPPTRFYVLWRYTYGAAELDAGEAIVFANGTHVELDGPQSLTQGSRALLEKKKSKYALHDYTERGSEKSLGVAGENGAPIPVIDALHRMLWLQDNKPMRLQEFLDEAKPNIEQLRLLAQALSGPALKGGALPDVTSSAEQAALGKLLANWNAVVVGQAAMTDRKTGQQTLFS